jgi:hypothetical protein
MPVINPAAMKFIMLLLGSLLVLSPISIIDNQEITVLHETDTYYEIQIPDGKDYITLYVNDPKYGESLLPIDGIFIIDQDGKIVQEFDLFDEINIDTSLNPETIRDKFADFFQQLPEEKKQIIAPYLKRAYSDQEGLLKELKKKSIENKVKSNWFNR